MGNRGIVYERGHELIEIKVLDGSGYVIEKFKFSTDDKKLGASIFSIIRRKYGISAEPLISPEESKGEFWVKD